MYVCVPTPGNLPSKAKKVLMPVGQPGEGGGGAGGVGAGGIDFCIIFPKILDAI